MSTIGVDFDGVIHKYSNGWQNGEIYDEPVTYAFSALNVLMQNHAVFVFTAREDLQSVANYLVDHGDVTCHVGYDGQFWNRRDAILVTNRKFPADAYIDDRGIRFAHWPQAMDEMRSLGVI